MPGAKRWKNINGGVPGYSVILRRRGQTLKGMPVCEVVGGVGAANERAF